MNIIQDTFFGAKTQTLAPLQELPLHFTGSFLRVTESDFDFEIKVGATGEWMPAGLGFEWATRGDSFTGVTIRNPHPTVGCFVRLFYGNGRMDDNRLNVVTTRPNQFVIFQEGSTVTSGGTHAIGTLSYEEFVGAAVASPARGRRKSIVVTNTDAASPVHVQINDSGWFEAATVYPQRLVKLDTDATVRIYNPSGGTVSVKVLEIFYKA